MCLIRSVSFSFRTRNKFVFYRTNSYFTEQISILRNGWQTYCQVPHQKNLSRLGFCRITLSHCPKRSGKHPCKKKKNYLYLLQFQSQRYGQFKKWVHETQKGGFLQMTKFHKTFILNLKFKVPTKYFVHVLIESCSLWLFLSYTL